MPKKLTPLALAGMSFTPLFAIADTGQANNAPDPSDSEISTKQNNHLENIQPTDVAIAAPPETLEESENLSTTARTLEEAPWLQKPMQPTVGFTDNQEVRDRVEAASPTAPPESMPIEFTPRIGASYTTSDGGVGALSSISGFLPLQTSPHDLFFLEGNWRFEQGDRLEGISAALGYRTFASKGDRVWGGYVAYDKRTTDFSVFHQLGLGFETLGNVDFRINGYIPLGQSRNLYATNSFESVTRTSDLYFRDRYLSYDTLRISGEDRFYEVALGGFDAELGVKLLSFGRPSNDLRLYGGAYYYRGEGITPTWGWRARLEARPTDLLSIALSLQQDDLFGTNLAFRIGANFPSYRRKRKLKGNETHLLRLADPVSRNSTIATTSDTESELTVREEQVLAKNPETGEPWVFRHVTLGRMGGDGTFENPFGIVQDGLNTSLSDGNHIVYVDLGANPDIPGFSIPDRVQVLSRGPVQSLDTIQFGTLQIPLSGTGQYPTVRGTTTAAGSLTGMVALGSYSTLSGFEIQANGNNGIIGHNIVGAIARDNRIFNGDRGVYLQGDGATSSLTLLRAEISNMMQQGIFLEALNGGEIPETTITDVQITDSDRGVHLQGDKATSHAEITNISISDIVQQAIFLEALNGGATEATVANAQITDSERGVHLQGDNATNQVDVARVTISETLQQAIFLEAANEGSAEATIEDVQITNSDRGVHLQGDRATSHVNITNISISDIVQQAIFLEALNDGATEATVTNAQITNSDRGIHLLGNNGTGSIDITNALVENSTQEGILLETFKGGEIAPSTVRDSIISDAENGFSLLVDNGTGSINLLNNSIDSIIENGISLNLANGGTLQDITARDNQIENVENGIVLQANSGIVKNTELSNNSIENANEIGVFFKLEDDTIIDNTRVSGNTLSAIPKEGILIWSADSNVSNLVISDNNIQDIFVLGESSASDGIEVRIRDSSTASNVIVANNILNKISDDGIAIVLRNAAPGNAIDGLTIENNIISDSGFNSNSGCGAGIEIANNDNNSRRINNVSLLNNQIIRSTHANIAFDSRISRVSGTNDGGSFGVTNFSGNSSIDPQSGVDLLLRLGDPVIFEFLSLDNINTVNKSVVNLDTEIANFTNTIDSNPNFDLNLRRKRNCPAL
ncbi:MAG: right-handed parallel beta-helix repeat-containing protein [Cyanobacteria bacterium P01_E01_bin.42]